ncbi:hypothetical protein FACS189465_2510 [Clostridia bacterium]|nr:hypothetical protein FACS189465_2510 [Clostridia bacterium]
MNAVVKKKVINVITTIIAISSVFIAIYCMIFKFRTVKFDFDRINTLAAKSILTRSIFSDFAYKNENINSEPNEFSGFNAFFHANSFQNVKDLPIIPENSSETSDTGNQEQIENSEPLKPKFGEKTYRIIESQFGSTGIKHENFFVKNSTNYTVDIGQELSKFPEINIKTTIKPQVLIFHTHATESYMMAEQGYFCESFYPRSDDNKKNVIMVGNAVVDSLKKCGINAIHDTTHHDYPSYNGSYARSAKTVRARLEENPSIQVVIDIHRDSMGDRENGKIKPTFKYAGKKAAQLMIISGCDLSGKLGFPEWEKNLRLALRLQKCLETMFPGITRALNFSEVKYNMHLTKGSLLIEIGSDVNSLNEAVYTGSMLGEALGKVLKSLVNR